MTATEQLKLIVNEQYELEDVEIYKIELRPGLINNEVDDLANKLPAKRIPDEIRELLIYSRGFDFLSIEEVTFDGVGYFGFEEFFPNSVQLLGDGFGNFWIVDISNQGEWENVFYVCHDPPVIVKHSENLTQFIKHIDDFGKNGNNSNLGIIHERVVMDIWTNDDEFIEVKNAYESNDVTLKDFALLLPENFVIIDLRNKPIQTGFSWGRFGSKIENTKRHSIEMIWGIEKPIKKSFFSKLFR
jgi:hypothetical protein